MLEMRAMFQRTSPRSSAPPPSGAGVRYEETEAIASIVLDRPDRKNTLDANAARALAAALTRAASNPDIRAIRLASAGSPFCVGSVGEDELDQLGPQRGRAAGLLFRALATLPKPIVAEVGGLAAGSGATLLLLCDLVIAAPSAVFHFPSAKSGTLPSAGASVLLAARIGLQHATECLYFGERMGAEDAHRLGIVNAIVPRERLEETVMARLAHLAQLPHDALVAIKRLLRAPLHGQIEEAIARELETTVPEP